MELYEQLIRIYGIQYVTKKGSAWKYYVLRYVTLRDVNELLQQQQEEEMAPSELVRHAAPATYMLFILVHKGEHGTAPRWCCAAEYTGGAGHAGCFAVSNFAIRNRAIGASIDVIKRIGAQHVGTLHGATWVRFPPVVAYTSFFFCFLF